jgi:hypothetical protein
MGLNAGVFGEKLSGGYAQAVLQPQDIVRGENDGSFAAALSKTRDARIAPEFEAALFAQLSGLHHLHVQINHTMLLNVFSMPRKSYQNYCQKEIPLSRWLAAERGRLIYTPQIIANHLYGVQSYTQKKPAPLGAGLVFLSFPPLLEAPA